MSRGLEARILRRTSGRVRLHVPGLASRAEEIEHRVASFPGVIQASANPLTENLLVRFDPACVDEASVLAAVRSSSRPARRRRSGLPVAPPSRLSPDGWLQAERGLVVDASAATCLEVVSAFERYPEWQEFVTSVEVHERDRRGRGVVVETRGRLGAREVRHVMRYRYPTPNQVAFTQERGDLEAVQGSWQFHAARAGRARAHYRLMVRPGTGLSLFLRGDLYERLREALLDHTLGELAARVERITAGDQARRGKIA